MPSDKEHMPCWKFLFERVLSYEDQGYGKTGPFKWYCGKGVDTDTSLMFLTYSGLSPQSLF
jgi:hypothetical protein